MADHLNIVVISVPLDNNNRSNNKKNSLAPKTWAPPKGPSSSDAENSRRYARASNDAMQKHKHKHKQWGTPALVHSPFESDWRINRLAAAVSG